MASAALFLFAVASASAQDPELLGTSLPTCLQEPTESRPFIDFRHSEVELFFGVAVYSSDFEADPGLALGLLGRVPIPGILERLGVYAEIFGSGIRRDLPDEDRGTGIDMLLGAGLDYGIYEGERFLVRVGLGLMYGFFLDVPQTDDGLAGSAGATFGVRITEKLWITARGEFITAIVDVDGDERDWTAIVGVGARVRF